MDTIQLVLTILGIVVSVMFMLLPFIVSAIRSILRELLEEQKRSNKATEYYLRQIAAALGAGRH